MQEKLVASFLYGVSFGRWQSDAQERTGSHQEEGDKRATAPKEIQAVRLKKFALHQEYLRLKAKLA